MDQIAGLPYAEVEFTKDGTIFKASEVDVLLDAVEKDAISDLFVMSHGWLNDMQDARRLYQDLFERVAAEMGAGRVDLTGRTFGILGILWPAKKFAEKDLIASGAAAAGSPITDEYLDEHLQDLKGLFDAPDADAVLEAARDLVPKLEDSPSARTAFVDNLRGLVTDDAANEEDASTDFFALSGDAVMQRLSLPVMPAPPSAAVGGATGGVAAIGDAGGGMPPGDLGGAAGIGQFFSGMKSAARNLLNFLTYYQMKARSGAVGQGGANLVLRDVRGRKHDVKLHLIGHSFGARLVTAAVIGPADQPSVIPDSLTLLQAAFSHYGFADRYDGTHPGSFRAVVGNHLVDGPLLISHSVKDLAVGVAYPLASLIAGQVAAALGDANDPYGGLGRNGAQKTPEASNGMLLGTSGTYAFDRGGVYNLNADAIIMGHSDICKDEVAHAILSSVATT
jgi:hypothetical protein